MAAAIGISPSYLNLIEHNQRPVTVALLFKLGQSFDVDLKDFASDDTSRLLTDITEMFADPAMEGHSVSKREMRDLSTASRILPQQLPGLYGVPDCEIRYPERDGSEWRGPSWYFHVIPCRTRAAFSRRKR